VQRIISIQRGISGKKNQRYFVSWVLRLVHSLIRFRKNLSSADIACENDKILLIKSGQLESILAIFFRLHWNHAATSEEQSFASLKYYFLGALLWHFLFHCYLVTAFCDSFTYALNPFNNPNLIIVFPFVPRIFQDILNFMFRRNVIGIIDVWVSRVNSPLVDLSLVLDYWDRWESVFYGIYIWISVSSHGLTSCVEFVGSSDLVL
jgi:hypothetical protein